MKHVVGVAEMAISSEPADTLITHALGSCLGIAAHDPRARIGGLLHVMMPMSRINPEKAKDNPCFFVDTGVPHFLDMLFERGARKQDLVVSVAGGACVNRSETDRFAIGKRNFVVFKKLLWKNGILIAAQDVGGDKARTMRIEIASGRVELSSGSERWELEPGMTSRQIGGARHVA
ncbi:MAG: chemotaxis protein CheD [Armatimonadia bacterium]|nr:chemotaxis protein CheD [Armatimonadia bacterium]